MGILGLFVYVTHLTDVSLSLSLGFQRCKKQMLPPHFKGDILLALGLDHLQD